MNASNLLLNAYVRDEIALGGEEQRLIGLINRMRLFAPPDVVKGAEAVVRAIVEISLEPSIEVRRLAKEALSESLDPDAASVIQLDLPCGPRQRAPNGSVKQSERAAHFRETGSHRGMSVQSIVGALA